MDRMEFPEAVEWAEGALSDLLASMEDYELIELCQRTGNSPEIWNMDQLDEVMSEYELTTPTEIIESIVPGFNTADEWFSLDRDDRFFSFSSLKDVPFNIPIYKIVQDILHDMNSYGNDSVAEILDEVMEDSY